MRLLRVEIRSPVVFSYGRTAAVGKSDQTIGPRSREGHGEETNAEMDIDGLARVRLVI